MPDLILVGKTQGEDLRVYGDKCDNTKTPAWIYSSLEFIIKSARKVSRFLSDNSKKNKIYDC
jgi:hypothetical protein